MIVKTSEEQQSKSVSVEVLARARPGSVVSPQGVQVIVVVLADAAGNDSQPLRDRK